jgi:Immunoglobulin-like domain of bacterial spore germination
MKRILPFCILILTILACSISSAPASTPNSTVIVYPTESLATTATAVSTPTVPAITVDQLNNALYQLVVKDSHPTVQLVNGVYQNGTDTSSPDYVSVTLAKPMAFGDLNGDGVSDAVVLMAENYGGTGVFVSVVAMLNKGGQPVEAASGLIDDRPTINSISIKDGQIYLDATVHGPNDPGCCAAQPTQRTYRYEADQLVITDWSMTTPDHQQRTITIDSPVDGADVSWPFTVTGHFTVAPFENTLAYSVYDRNHNQVAVGPLTVNAQQPGGPGTFSLSLDLSSKNAAGPLEIQVEDTSAADGSILALASVGVNLK